MGKCHLCGSHGKELVQALIVAEKELRIRSSWDAALHKSYFRPSKALVVVCAALNKAVPALSSPPKEKQHETERGGTGYVAGGSKGRRLVPHDS